MVQIIRKPTFINNAIAVGNPLNFQRNSFSGISPHICSVTMATEKKKKIKIKLDLDISNNLIFGISIYLFINAKNQSNGTSITDSVYQ